LRFLTRLGIGATFRTLMMLLLADFLGVRDVSWISHQCK
jgi:hypothetical protein